MSSCLELASTCLVCNDQSRVKLTARFCQSAGIAYEHIGPVVFYRGFTRERLDQDLAAHDAAQEAAEGGGAEKEVVVEEFVLVF